jgi:hypothetical protein
MHSTGVRIKIIKTGINIERPSIANWQGRTKKTPREKRALNSLLL